MSVSESAVCLSVSLSVCLCVYIKRLREDRREKLMVAATGERWAAFPSEIMLQAGAN